MKTFPCSVRFCAGTTPLSGAPCESCRTGRNVVEFRPVRRRRRPRIIVYAFSRYRFMASLHAASYVPPVLGGYFLIAALDSEPIALLLTVYWVAFACAVTYASGVCANQLKREAMRLVRARVMGRRRGGCPR